MCILIIVSLANLIFRYGAMPGYHFYLLFLGSIPFFMFENKLVIFAYFLSILGIYLVYDFRYSAFPITPDSELGFLYYPNLICAITVFFFIVYNFKSQSLSYQSIIKAQVDDLSQLSFKLMLQKDEIVIKSNQLQQKSLVLENQNHSIYESLRLAALLQREALPPLETIFNGIKSGFLLYKPKDVVSGDFYWAKSTWHGTIIVVADCIGHGVPGAMMAVLAANLISQIVEDQGKCFPSEILLELDRRLQRRIKQDPESELADGMDIAVVLIKDQNVSFAAASRPIVKISTDGKVQIYKGTRNQLAAAKPKFSEYETLELTGEQGDRFYLFTDGAADQFENTSGKRLGTKQLISELSQIQHLSLSIQKEEMESFYKKWQGDQKQTDDILLIGFET